MHELLVVSLPPSVSLPLAVQIGQSIDDILAVRLSRLT
jgi:hypothetical protein